MTNLAQAYTKRSQSILEVLLYLTYIGLFLPIRISNIPLIALMLFCAFTFRPKDVIAAIRKNVAAKVLIGLYLLYIIGLLYTSNRALGLVLLERKVSFLLFPLLVLPALIREDLDVPRVLRRIGYITLASSFILLAIATFKKITTANTDSFFFENFTSIHYVYYSLYFACGALFLIDSFFNDSKMSRKNLAITITLILIYALVILVLVASKTGIIVFIATVIVFLYMKFKKAKVFWLCLIVFVALAIAILYINKTTVHRFSELDKNLTVLTQKGPIHGDEITDLNMRLLFWKISLTHAWKDGILLTGVGPGDAQDYLDTLYTLPGYGLTGFVGWNSHNQWVYLLIQLGLAPIILVGFLYGACLVRAIQQRNFTFLCFLLITLGFSLSECLLERNKGILFFCLILTLLSVSRGPNATLVQDHVPSGSS